MSVSFIDGKLVIEEEIRLKIPTPADITLPTPPVVPSFDFPPIPDVAGDVLKIKNGLDQLKFNQDLNPSFSVDIGGSQSIPGSGGVDSELKADIPSSNVDFDSIISSINIPLPTPPVAPSFDFPPIPDTAGDIIDIKLNLDRLSALQGANPSFSIQSNGASTIPGADGSPPGQGGGGFDFSESCEIPSAAVDFDLLKSSINIPLPTPPVVPSFDFPPIPNPLDLFGNLGVDPELYKKSENNPQSSGSAYDPTAPDITVKVFINDVEV